MRRLALCLFLLALAAANFGVTEETVAGLKERAEKASPEECSQLCIQVALHQLRNADKLYFEGHIEEARAAIDDVITYSEKARDAAIQTNKRLKNVEIDARKMAERLRDIKRTLVFEDQAPVDRAIRRLEDIRTVLLKEMFSNKKEKR
jgi:soluble cytochrome b562